MCCYSITFLMLPSYDIRTYVCTYLLTSLLLDSNFLSSSLGFLLLPLSSLRQSQESQLGYTLGHPPTHPPLRTTNYAYLVSSCCFDPCMHANRKSNIVLSVHIHTYVRKYVRTYSETCPCDHLYSTIQRPLGHFCLFVPIECILPLLL